MCVKIFRRYLSKAFIAGVAGGLLRALSAAGFERVDFVGQ